MSLVYAAGTNEPGYMPAEHFTTFDEAKRYVINALKCDEDNALMEEEAEDLAATAEGVNLETSPFSVTVAGRAYWVQVAESL